MRSTHNPTGWIRIRQVCGTAHIYPPKGLSPLTVGIAALRLRAAGQLAVRWLIFFAFHC